jgi:hypothetical protein
MITEDDLRRTLHTHERLAPDPAPVAARITAGIRARRRHRYAGTAAVAVATVVAVGVPTLVLRDAGPTGGTGTVAAPSQTRPPVTPAAPPTVRFDPLTVPFTVGWLPDGWFEDGIVRTFPGSAERSYENDQGTGEVVVRVWDTKVSGKPATDVPPVQGGAIVRRQLSRTVWLLVGGPLSDQDLNRLLRSVDVRAPEALAFPFRMTWLPAGYRVTGAGSGAHHWHGDAAGNTLAADPPLLDAGVTLDRTSAGDALSVYVSTEDGMWEDKGLRPNGTLLGHPSYYREEYGNATLHVYGVHGMHISIDATSRPELNRGVLERVARGLRLVGTPDQPADWTDQPLP